MINMTQDIARTGSHSRFQSGANEKFREKLELQHSVGSPKTEGLMGVRPAMSYFIHDETKIFSSISFLPGKAVANAVSMGTAVLGRIQRPSATNL
jgi:hypothetical protein